MYFQNILIFPFTTAFIHLFIDFKDTVFSPGCAPFNGALPTGQVSTTTTPNPCGDDFKCESTPFYCIKPSQVWIENLL